MADIQSEPAVPQVLPAAAVKGTLVDDPAPTAKPSGDDAMPKAPPSTPTKTAGESSSDSEAERKKVEFVDFPRFKVTWDASVPSALPRSPGKKRKNSLNSRPDGAVSRAQEMGPETTLIEFIATSASFHNVQRQNLQQLEGELLKVFTNNVMPANAAAWYMAKRRFYTDDQNQSQLLTLLLKNYPKKFLVKNNVVHFLEVYSKQVAKKKMHYMVEQGMYAYFSHKVDEYGVYFFDPYYYETTEPFHANLRLATGVYNNHRSKLIPAFFSKFKSQFILNPLSPYLVSISKTKTDVLSDVTGIIVSMVDNQSGIIQFPHGNGTEKALFSAKSLFKNGYQYQLDPQALPPVLFDGYKLSTKNGDYGWHAVLVWCGKKPSPKFCSTLEDLQSSKYFRGQSNKDSNDAQIEVMNNNVSTDDDTMRVGLVLDIRKNGAVVSMHKESEERAFIPGWHNNHLNTPGTTFLTTTQGVGLCLGDLIAFYLDSKQVAKPYDAVGCNVMVVRHSDSLKADEKAPTEVKGAKKKEKKGRLISTATQESDEQGRQKGRKPKTSWVEFLTNEDLAPSDIDEEVDHDYELPIEYESDDVNSVISDDEAKEILHEAGLIQAGTVKVGLDPADFLEKEKEDESEEFKDAKESVETEAKDETDQKKADGVVRIKKSWASFLLCDDMATDDAYNSDDDPEYVPFPIADVDLDYDEYSDSEIAQDEVDGLSEDPAPSSCAALEAVVAAVVTRAEE